MKKIITLLLACALLFSCTAVYAADTPSLHFLKQSTSVTDVEESGTLHFALNEPFGLLELLAEDAGSMSHYIDVVTLVEGLFDSTMAVRAKTKITNGGKKQSTETHLQSNIAFQANENLEGDVRTNSSVWAEIDFSDEENPYFDVVMTHPFAAKYITVDSNLLLQNEEATEEDILEVFQAFLVGQNFAVRFYEEAIDSIERNASVTGNSKKVRIAFTDIGLKMFLMDVISSVFGEIDESILADFNADAVKDVLSQVPVFGKEAMVMEYTLDSQGRVSKEKTMLHVDLNMYDLMLAMGEEAPPEESGITREQCKINFTMTSQTNYKYHSVEIKKPVLTEENSIDIFEYADPYYYYEPVEEEDYAEDRYYPWPSVDLDENCFENEKLTYVPFRSFFEEMGYAVHYDNGAIRANISSAHAMYQEYYFAIGADVVYTELNEIAMHTPLFVKDGTTYISIQDCENLTHMMKSRITYYFEDAYAWIDFFDPEY